MQPRMNYVADKHHRRSIRLKGYDYSQAGAYFVTVVTQDRACLFGEVANGGMQLNDAGAVIEHWWIGLQRKFSTIETDDYVIMPTHFHGIIVIADVTVGADLRVGPHPEGAHTAHEGTHAGVPLQGTHPVRQGAGRGAPMCAPGGAAGVPVLASRRSPERPAVPTVVQWFKTMTTNDYMRGVKRFGWTPFTGRLWQRNYYEHIIRDDQSLNRIRQYILNNPARWEFDRENPAAATHEPEDEWRV